MNSTGKRITIRVLVATLVLLTSFMATADAQKGRSLIRRVNFPRGRTTAVLKGTVKRGDYTLADSHAL